MFTTIVLTLKNPITTTSSDSVNFLASSVDSKILAGGPVFFFSQLTMSAAWRPPVCKKITLNFGHKTLEMNLTQSGQVFYF